jgi:hypothetical protein
MTPSSEIDAAVKKLAADLTDAERDHWLRVVRACYDIASRIGGDPFAKAWLVGYHDAPFHLRRLARYGILERVDTSRRGHRAYWRLRNPEAVGAALRQLGYL